MGFITNFIEGFNSVGSPSITYFNGTITRNQLITIIVVMAIIMQIITMVILILVILVIMCQIKKINIV